MDTCISLSVSIYTFKTLVKHPEWVIGFVESTFAFTDPFLPKVGLGWIKAKNTQASSRRFTPQSWKRCQDELMRGTLSALFTYFDSEETPGTVMPLWTITMTNLPELQGEPKTERDDNTPLWAMPVPSSLHFRLLFPTPNTPVGKSLQSDIADFAQRLFRETDSSYGFISLDNRDIYNDLAATKFERDSGIDTVHSTRFLARKVRGVFWENYLTTGHIYQLGGIRSIKANAPCTVKELNSDKAVALRLTEDVNDVTLSQIEALEHYFRPLALTKVELEERSRPG